MSKKAKVKVNTIVDLFLHSRPALLVQHTDNNKTIITFQEQKFTVTTDEFLGIIEIVQDYQMGRL